MQADFKFALIRDDDHSVVLDEEPSGFDQERWRRRPPAIGETIVIGGHRGRVRERISREVRGDDGETPALEIEILIEPEDA